MKKPVLTDAQTDRPQTRHVCSRCSEHTTYIIIKYREINKAKLAPELNVINVTINAKQKHCCFTKYALHQPEKHLKVRRVFFLVATCRQLAIYIPVMGLGESALPMVAVARPAAAMVVCGGVVSFVSRASSAAEQVLWDAPPGWSILAFHQGDGAGTEPRRPVNHTHTHTHNYDTSCLHTLYTDRHIS